MSMYVCMYLSSRSYRKASSLIAVHNCPIKSLDRSVSAAELTVEEKSGAYCQDFSLENLQFLQGCLGDDVRYRNI